MIKTKLIVKGMMCVNCEAAVVEATMKNLPIESVDADHQNDTIILESNDALDETKVREVIEGLGYQLEGVETL